VIHMDCDGSIQSNGDCGVVIGLADSDSENNVLCRFSDGPRLEISVSRLQLQLPGSLRIGDAVITTIDLSDKNGRVAIGDRGIVSGPSKTDRAKKVVCRFPNDSKFVVLPSLLDLELAGGFRVGDAVVSSLAISDQNGTVAIGDCGVVHGPSATDRIHSVLCKFPAYSKLQILASKLKLQLAGSIRIGDAVISKIDKEGKNQSVAIGDRGHVIGRASLPGSEFLCRFPNFQQLNVLQKEVELELPGGFLVGDVVIRKVDFKNPIISVAAGDRGTVIGRSTTCDKTNLLCQFPNCPKFNFWAGNMELEDGPKSSASSTASTAVPTPASPAASTSADDDEHE